MQIFDNYRLLLNNCIIKRSIRRQVQSIVIRSIVIKWPRALLQGTPHFGENFRGLVLGCMGTYDSESRRIFSHFSRSTRFSFLCTAPHSNICQFFVFIFAFFSTKFHHFLRISNQFHVFSSRFWWKFVGISRNWKMLHKISAKSQILTN